MRSVNVFSILMLIAVLVAVMVAPTMQADNNITTNNTNSTERKYPKQYRLIQDRLQTNRRTLDQEGSWSEWTSWTQPCSGTCGGGVSAQMRHCSTLRARYELMMKCWREDPQERPQFAELVKTIEDLLGVGMDYLDLGCLAGVSNREYFMSSDSDGSIPKGLQQLRWDDGEDELPISSAETSISRVVLPQHVVQQDR